MNKIPKKIFQTWETKTFNEEFQKIINTWKECNPEYEYFLYDNIDCEEFIKNNFNNNVYDAYCRIIPGAYKADLWRYCILYKYGGVYIDIDTICLGNIDTFLNNDIEMMVPIDLNINPHEGKYNLFNAFIASVPNSDILLNCINRIVFNVENNIITSFKMDFSGPGLLGRETNKYLQLNEDESFVGKEGIYNNIHFLKFEQQMEYVKDVYGNILFQNKNGNYIINELYNIECKKVNNINWYTARIIIKPPRKIAIFNGFPFHYEMFGYIINYCKKYNYQLDIYSINTNEAKNFLFYKKLFGKSFTIYSTDSFETQIENYDYIFLTTDDDMLFKDEWINQYNLNNKIICIDHDYRIRRPNIDMGFHLGTRPFALNHRKWALPCYPIVYDVQEKMELINNSNNIINIVLLGGGQFYNLSRINRLSSESNVIIHCISRVVNLVNYKHKSENFEIKIYENIDTIQMMNIIKKANYILSDITYTGHEFGGSMSGSIPIAFSTLTPLILSKHNNTFYKFKSVIEFDESDNSDIVVYPNNDSNIIQKIYDERCSLIEMFDTNMNELIKQT